MARAIMILMIAFCLLPALPRAADAARKQAAAQTATSYVCPMHPEARASEPGKCSKCAMELVSANPAVVDEFDMKLECSPLQPRPNERIRLRFVAFNPKTGEQVKQFAVMHDKLFHLFIVSQDMKEFQHIHPTFEPDSSFTITTSLSQPGHYKVYSDIYPLEGAPQVIQHNLITAGYKSDLFASQPKLTPDASLVKVVDDMKIELKLEPEEIIAGRPASLKYRLTDATTGKPVGDLVPYLGAWGHTLMLSEDQSDYVHSHPEEIAPETAGREKLSGGPDVTFNALLPRPGIYRVWTQFQRGDKLTTVSFTIRAARLH